jgi:hypothetical protein
MKINLTINDELMAEAQRVSRISDKNVLIEAALKLFVTVRNQNKLLELWGKVEFDGESLK